MQSELVVGEYSDVQRLPEICTSEKDVCKIVGMFLGATCMIGLNRIQGGNDEDDLRVAGCHFNPSMLTAAKTSLAILMKSFSLLHNWQNI